MKTVDIRVKNKNEEVKKLIKEFNSKEGNTPLYCEIYELGSGRLFSLEKEELKKPTTIRTMNGGEFVLKEIYYKLIGTFDGIAELMVMLKLKTGTV